ncbi:MAG: hypothetical protein AAB661_01670 [Patescibacteria group bacterium]
MEPPAGLSATGCGREGPEKIDNWLILSAVGHYAFLSKAECAKLESQYASALGHGIGHGVGLWIHTPSEEGKVDVMGYPAGPLISFPLLKEVVAWWYAQTPGARVQ